MRIVIATTGSGGHLYCGLGIANAIKERTPDAEIYLLGSKGDYKIYANRFLLSQVIGIIQSGLLYLYLRPHVIVSTGGFASVGIVFWGWLFNKPCIIHEQNLVPGKANRLLAPLADKILVSFEETEGYFKGRHCIFTGMPIRFKNKIPQQEAREKLGLEKDRFTILVMGGSKGAHRINEIIIDMLGKLPRDMQFIHLTGTRDLGFVREAYKKNDLSAYVEDFSNRMDVIYSASNLVIGRAGSGMLAEITFFGLPSILIPYPYSRDRHQYKNADFMARHGAAVVMSEEDVSIDPVRSKSPKATATAFRRWTSNGVDKLIGTRDRSQEMARNSESLARPDAVEKIVDVILSEAKNLVIKAQDPSSRLCRDEG